MDDKGNRCRVPILLTRHASLERMIMATVVVPALLSWYMYVSRTCDYVVRRCLPVLLSRLEFLKRTINDVGYIVDPARRTKFC